MDVIRLAAIALTLTTVVAFVPLLVIGAPLVALAIVILAITCVHAWRIAAGFDAESTATR